MKLLIFGILFSSTLMIGCDPSREYREDWKCVNKPIHGRYYRKLNKIVPRPKIEYIDILNDTAYFYYFESENKIDSFSGTYDYVTYSPENCQIHFKEFRFPYSHTQADDKNGGKAYYNKFFCDYGVTDDKAYIENNPHSENDIFMLDR